MLTIVMLGVVELLKRGTLTEGEGSVRDLSCKATQTEMIYSCHTAHGGAPQHSA
jgi:hypothetical protein